MYLRHTTVRKGRTYNYWKLVRPVRHGSGGRQEVVAHLGRLDAEEKRRASALAKHFLGPTANQPELFEGKRPPRDRVTSSGGLIAMPVWRPCLQTN